MRTRSTGLSLFVSLALFAMACAGPASPPTSAPSVAAPTDVASEDPSEEPTDAASDAPSDAPSDEPSVDPSDQPSGDPSGEPGEGLKIGVVTDVGTLDDKNFNQFSYEGAERGAEAVGGTVEAIVTQESADYAANVQSFIDQDYDVIVTVGFALGNDTTIAAKANPEVSFVGVDQAPCVTAEGDPDPEFACAGDPAELLPNYQGVVFAEAQPGYLAGIVAASITESDVIGAIGGASFIPPVTNYIAGYENGARSVNPDIEVVTAFVSDDLAKAFNDPAGGQAFAEQLLEQNPEMDVLFQVAGKTGNGVLQAACDADIHAIGVDVDQHESTPETADCTVTSAEKKLSNAVMQAIERVADGTAVGGVVVNDASNEGIGLSPFYESEELITAETQQAIDDAIAAMAAGELDPNPAP